MLPLPLPLSWSCSAFVLALAFVLIAFGRLTSLSFMQWCLGSLATGLGDMTLEGKGIDKALVMTARAKKH